MAFLPAISACLLILTLSGLHRIGHAYIQLSLSGSLNHFNGAANRGVPNFSQSHNGIL